MMSFSNARFGCGQMTFVWLHLNRFVPRIVIVLCAQKNARDVKILVGLPCLDYRGVCKLLLSIQTCILA
jgi:hypothetical protein